MIKNFFISLYLTLTIASFAIQIVILWHSQRYHTFLEQKGAQYAEGFCSRKGFSGILKAMLFSLVVSATPIIHLILVIEAISAGPDFFYIIDRTVESSFIEETLPKGD